MPGKYGNAEIEYAAELDRFSLTSNGVLWMETESNCHHTRNTMFSQYDVAYGDVLVTGLGFGILTTALAEKDEVSSVTVLELSEDVIGAFIQNNQVSDKVKIIQADATTFTSDIKYDCLLPDHYELQTFKWRIKDMNRLAEAVPHDVFWPWSVEEIFLKKKYPRYAVKCSSDEVLQKYAKSIPTEWKQFIKNEFNSHPTLLNIEEEKLFDYLKKHAIYYYDFPNPYEFF